MGVYNEIGKRVKEFEDAEKERKKELREKKLKELSNPEEDSSIVEDQNLCDESVGLFEKFGLVLVYAECVVFLGEFDFNNLYTGGSAAGCEYERQHQCSESERENLFHVLSPE